MIYKVKTIQISYKLKEQDPEKISTEQEAFILAKRIYQDLDVDQEHFSILALNTRNETTGYKIISSGGQASALIDPKVVFRNALLLGAVSIILVHNHPSGGTTPSEEDIDLTHKLKKCGDFLQIRVLDHIIIANDKYYSFAENNLIK